MQPMTERQQCDCPLPARSTYYVRPCWVTDSEEGGYGFYTAVLMATGRTVAEDEDLTALLTRMTTAHPDLALVENSITLGRHADGGAQ